MTKMLGLTGRPGVSPEEKNKGEEKNSASLNRGGRLFLIQKRDDDLYFSLGGI